MNKYLLILLLLLNSNIIYAYDFMIDGLCYKVLSESERTVKVTWKASNDYYTGNIVIPERVTHNSKTYTVTTIGDYAFANVSIGSVDKDGEITGAGVGNNDELVSVKFPNTLKTINISAFHGCRKLSDVMFPTSLETIDYSAFGYCI